MKKKKAEQLQTELPVKPTPNLSEIPQDIKDQVNKEIEMFIRDIFSKL
jgi:hypothetical protein